MNTKNNKRKKETIHKVESVFLEFLQTKELNQISVSDICKAADINRSTFYASYTDVYDLADKLREKLERDVAELYADEHEKMINTNDFLKLFKHIYENQIFYRTYFKLGYDEKHQITIYDYDQAAKRFDNRFIDYHIEFFRNGLNAIIKKWLAGGCIETPDEMKEILDSEYKGRTDL